MVYAELSAQDSRPAVGGAAGAARLVPPRRAVRLADDRGPARGAARGVAGAGHDRGQPLHSPQQGAFQCGGGPPEGGFRPGGAGRRAGGAGGIRRGGIDRDRGGAGRACRLRAQPPAPALRRGRPRVSGGRLHRRAGGRTEPAGLPPQRHAHLRPARPLGGPGGAPLRHGAKL